MASTEEFQQYGSDPNLAYRRTTSSLTSRGYNIRNLSYPTGLGTSDDLQHEVAFFINTRGKSNFKYNTSSDLNKDIMGRIGTPGVATNVSPEKGGALAATVGAVTTGIGLATGQGPVGAGKAGLAAGGAVAATVGLTAVAQNSLDLLRKDNKNRLTDVITLHLEDRPVVKYGVNYQDKDIGILGNFLTSGSSLSDDITNAGTELGSAFLLQMAKIPSILPGLGSLTDAVQFGAKVKTNPFREVFFEGVDYRQFNFRYRFMPKDENESKNVKKIIDTFKFHMHPELSSNGYFYLYPSEFEIAYYYAGKENNYLHKIAPCVLTDMQVEYGGDQFSTFSNGAPVEINMVLSFREQELLTKEAISKYGF